MASAATGAPSGRAQWPDAYVNQTVHVIENVVRHRATSENTIPAPIPGDYYRRERMAASAGGIAMSAPSGGSSAGAGGGFVNFAIGFILILLAIWLVLGFFSWLANGGLKVPTPQAAVQSVVPLTQTTPTAPATTTPRLPPAHVRSSPPAHAVPSDYQIRYTGNSCTRSDGSTGAQGYSPSGQIACYRW